MEKMNFYFGFFMVAVYFAAGLGLTFFFEFESIPAPNRQAAGIVLMMFACYRLYRLLRMRRKVFHPEILDAPDDQE